MKRGAAALLVLSGFLAGCAGTPPPPDWQMNAQSAVDRATSAYLEGNTRVADAEWARARSAVRSTGRADLLSRVELSRCAAQLASLDVSRPVACPAFAPLAQDTGPPEQAYARFLAGQATPADVALLPAAQQALAVWDSAAGAAQAMDRLRAIGEPLPRLVAAAALLQRLPSAGLQPGDGLELAALAIETASAQGWRRPLLAWLTLQESWAQQAGNKALADQARRRLALVKGAGG